MAKFPSTPNYDLLIDGERVDTPDLKLDPVVFTIDLPAQYTTAYFTAPEGFRRQVDHKTLDGVEILMDGEPYLRGKGQVVEYAFYGSHRTTVKFEFFGAWAKSDD